MDIPETLADIYYAFHGRLVGTYKLKTAVCQTLSRMPQDTIDFVTANCWFIGSLDDAWAFAFTGNDLKDQHLIFLSDSLLAQDEHQIHYSIAHEIGHVMLGHKNSVQYKQTQEEINCQEKEADEFAQKYI